MGAYVRGVLVTLVVVAFPAVSSRRSVLHSLGGSASTLYAGAAQLGLAAADNLDGLEVVPEPATGLLLAASLAGLAACRRRGARRDQPFVGAGRARS